MQAQKEITSFYIKIKLYSQDQKMFDEFTPLAINLFLNEFSLFFTELEQSYLFIFNKSEKSFSQKNFFTKIFIQNYNKKKQYLTVIRSPHKYKDSREQFNLKIFNQTIYVIFPNWVPFQYFD